MPIYDFSCRDCGEVVEVLVRGTDGQAAHCPECASNNMEKLVSSSYVIRMGAPKSDMTSCGRAEPCQTSECSGGDSCWRE